MAVRRPAQSIRRRLQATSLMAVLAGYVILLSVNRQLSSRLRAERHQAQVQATTALLQDLQPQSLQPREELQRRLSELASPSLLVWMVWLEPDPATAGPAILPSGSVFQQWHPGHSLVKAKINAANAAAMGAAKSCAALQITGDEASFDGGGGVTGTCGAAGSASTFTSNSADFTGIGTQATATVAATGSVSLTTPAAQ